MKTFLLTLDYELYGNGSGDVFKHIVEPTDKILRVADSYNAKITIFFEVIEYWKLKEEWDKGNAMGYDRNPVEAMEWQIIRAYKNGHDIQLHLHPQWVNAKWTNDGWNVDLSQWRLGGYGGSGENSLLQLLQRGKETLETIINDDNYVCHTLRTGGYNVQPSQELVVAMKQVGLKIDTSIVPGARETGSLSKYDYRNIRQDKGFWYCGDSLENESIKKDLIELPIVAFNISRLSNYLTSNRIKSVLRNRQSAKARLEEKTSTNEENQKSRIIAKLLFFFQKDAQTWDYCLFSKRLHRKFLRTIAKQKYRDVFVLIGHPKSFISSNSLKYLLKKVSGDYKCDTISEYMVKNKLW